MTPLPPAQTQPAARPGSFPGTLPGSLGQLTRFRLEWWFMLAICLIGAAGLVHSGMTARIDHILYDAVLHQRRAPPTEDILIVALDDRSLTEVGAWPWPRATQARLVEQIAAARPRAIGLDILLTEPRDPAGDTALAGAIAQAGNVYLPLAFEVPGHNGLPVDVLPPLPAFIAAAAGTGHVNLTPDSDGVMRGSYLAYQTGGSRWPALPLAMLNRGKATRTDSSEADLVGSAPVLIDYPGSSGTIASVPASRVLAGEVPPQLLAGKLILVGMTASGLGDVHATPTADGAPLMPGVEIQASLMATLMAPTMLEPAGIAQRLALALGATLLLFIGLRLVPTRFSVLVVAGLIAAIGLVCLTLLLWGNLWLAPSAAIITVALGASLWGWRRLAVASAYVSRELERATADAGDLAHPDAGATSQLDRQLALLADTTARERELRLEHDAVIRLLSHDMRAPQSAILTMLDQADGAMAPDLPPDLVQRIRASARRTLELADGFVNLSRAQLLTFTPELLDLAELARDAADALWPQASARSIKIQVEAPAEEALVMGDASLLARMLINLTENAIKYGANNQPVRIVITRDTGGDVMVQVINAGPDIPPDQLARLFDLFARASGVDRRTDGFGLGLAFVLTVARRHGGSATCQSAGGETAFSVTLPQARAV